MSGMSPPMSPAVPVQNPRKRRLGRSFAALMAGFAVVIVLSIGTDITLNAAGLLPLGEPAPDRILFLATAYRTLYSVIAGYVIARLAPDRPVGHALIGGMVGLAVSVIGAVATWNQGLGPHWYPLALIVLSVPPAWAGGVLFVQRQTRKSVTRT